MSGLRARLRRLETRAEAEIKNCVCGGPNRVAIRIGDEPAPDPCPRCGTAGMVVRIVRSEPPPGWAEKWAHLEDGA
ncbi:MAG: hypothetical protein LAT64_02545 [Phycisphaerales bacterium]|nr:hypothetical protein [Planctomycetota bacterium]MCH8507637.1 hypothetical protein [Phycisphaerales bacterium]